MAGVCYVLLPFLPAVRGVFRGCQSSLVWEVVFGGMVLCFFGWRRLVQWSGSCPGWHVWFRLASGVAPSFTKLEISLSHAPGLLPRARPWSGRFF